MDYAVNKETYLPPAGLVTVCPICDTPLVDISPTINDVIIRQCPNKCADGKYFGIQSVDSVQLFIDRNTVI